MATLNLIEDDGFITVVMGDAEIRVDVYDAYNRLIDIHKAAEKHEEKQADAGEGIDLAASSAFPAFSMNEEIVKLIVSLGFPRVSHRAAVKFAEAIFSHMGELRKKDESAPSVSTSAD
jgi:hypothetical protein